jgi:ketosteroid isomerase-like protein
MLKKQLTDLDLAFSNEAVTGGQRGAFLAHMADEALLLDRGVRTRAAAADLMEKEGETKALSWAPFYVDVSAAGDLAYICGEWLFKGPGADGKPSEATGVYSAIWKRQADDSWKFVFDNGRPYPREVIERLKQRLAEVSRK